MCYSFTSISNNKNYICFEIVNARAEVLSFMDRVQQIIVRKDSPNYKACHLLCSFSKRLGNCAVYLMRQDVFASNPLMTSAQLDRKLKEIYPQDYKGMPSAASAQRMGQVCREQFRSFIAASAKYKVDDSFFTGKPRLPGYSKKYRTFYVSRNGFKVQDGFLSISGGKKFGFQPIKITCCQNQCFNAKASEAVCSDVCIVPKANCFIIEIVYRKKEDNLKKSTSLNKNNALFTDIGLNNIVACISTEAGVPPLLVKGGALKSINQWWNKRVAELQSQKKFSHIDAITFKRNNQINDYIHKIAHIVVSYCLAFDIGRIIIGRNQNWKQKPNMGKVNNQKFCNIPHDKLIENIKYLAEEYGIDVIVREESYTSKASALDFDKMPDTYQEDAVCYFFGKRVKRGLYRTSTGKLINADLNGAINIGRKELGDEWLRTLLANGGLADANLLYVDKPVVVRNLNKKLDCATLLKAEHRLCETADVSLR